MSKFNYIQVLLLKRVLNHVFATVYDIFNLIFEKGIYLCFLNGKVISIYKANDSKQLKNYNLISVLSTLNTILKNYCILG